MKKTIIIISLCCLAVLIVLGILLATPSKTVDFRGTVTKIETIDNDTVFHISMPDTSYIVRANNKTSISYCHKDDPDIKLSDIKIGDKIDGNYRWLTKNNTAKNTTVEYHK